MEKLLLTTEQAKSLLPEKDQIHTFRQPTPGAVLGCDIRREKILDMIDEAKMLEIGGEGCKSMNHALVIDETLFVESIKEIVDQLDSE